MVVELVELDDVLDDVVEPVCVELVVDELEAVELVVEELVEDELVVDELVVVVVEEVVISSRTAYVSALLTDWPVGGDSTP